MNGEGKVLKKVSFTSEEWDMIGTAMEEEGIVKFHDYVVNMVRTRNDAKDAGRRVWLRIKYQHSNLCTIYNKMMEGIDVEENQKKFGEEAGKLCQELR